MTHPPYTMEIDLAALVRAASGRLLRFSCGVRP